LSDTPSGLGPANPSRRAPPPRQRPLWRTTAWIFLAIVVAIAVAFLLTPHGQGQKGRGAGGRGGAAAAGRGGQGGAGGAGGRAPTVVGVATAQIGDIPIQLNELGTVAPQAAVTVQSQISGTLLDVYFKEGQTVRQGQVLALIDPRPYQIALQQAEGQLARDQAALAEARLDEARYRTLVAQDSIARQTYDQQVATVKQDEGVVRVDQAAVTSARLNINYCHIKAPVAGRVGLRQIDPGNLVTTNEPNGLVVVNQIDPATVIFTLPEDEIPQVAQRMAAVGELPATATDRTGATALAQGVLYTLDNVIDTATGTVKARARFANPSGTLFANQFVNVTVLVDTLRNVVTVPAVAIRHGPQGDFVYVIQPDSTVKVTAVKVGPAQGETASIQSGLSAGDEVVTEGGDRLSDGARVIQPKDAARFAQMQARQRPAGGIVGWIEGLFGMNKQPAGGPGYGGAASGASGSGYGGRRAAMLASLNLTPDQQAKATQIFADARQKAQAAGDDSDARRQIMQDANNQLEAILTPEQKAKFEAARSQMRNGGQGAPAGAASGQPPPAGASAAQASSSATSNGGHRHGQASAASGQPPAAPSASANAGGPPGGPGGHGPGRFIGQLGLSPSQQAQAQQIFSQARSQAQASSDPDARRAAMRQAIDKLNAILTPEQKAKLAALRAQGRGGGNGGG